MLNKLLLSLLGVIFLANLLNANNVVSWNFDTYFTANSLKFNLKFFAPTDPGNYPVGIFLMGSGSYSSFLEEIVRKNERIIISLDGLRTSISSNQEDEVFKSTLDWILENINNLFNYASLPTNGVVLPNLGQGVSLIGHSAGAHTLVSYLADQCGSASSLVLIDPVGGRHPFSNNLQTFETRPLTKFAIPTLIVASAKGSEALNFFTSPCSPSDRSNRKFYEFSKGPTWYMNFTQYGNGDIYTTGVIIAFVFI